MICKISFFLKIRVALYKTKTKFKLGIRSRYELGMRSYNYLFEKI